MGWNESDLLVIGGMLLFAALLVGLAEANHRWQKKCYMFGKDTHSDCQCRHRGYEHSYRHGNCRYEQVIGGLLLKCPCPGFREAWNTEEIA